MNILKSLILLGLIAAGAASAVPAQNPYCTDFNLIHSSLRRLSASDVQRMTGGTDWVEDRNRRADGIQLTGNGAFRAVVLVLFRRVSPFDFTAGRAEAATVTGSYIRNADSFYRFLQLRPERACNILGFPGREADELRSLTRNFRVALQSSRR